MQTQEKLVALRKLMSEAKVKAVYIPSTDPHQTESVSSHWKAMQWLTGFTGSMGYAVVTDSAAEFWTDGRYVTQAKQEIAPNTFHINCISEPGTLGLHQWLKTQLHEADTLAVDGEVLSEAMLRSFTEKLPIKGLRIQHDRNFIDEIWTNRPAVPQDPIWELENHWAAKTRSEKLATLRTHLKSIDEKATTLICSLDDVAWITNLRGNDNPLYPFFHAYAFISLTQAYLCTDLFKLSDEIRAHLIADGWTLCEYKAINDIVKMIEPTSTLYVDPYKTPFSLYESIPAGVTIIDGPDLVTAQKAQKCAKEQNNIRRANILECVAIVRFMRWIEANVTNGALDEFAIGRKLEDFRRTEPLYLQPANIPIIGYGENAALPHYRPSKMTTSVVKPEGFLLFDVCAHYLCGTTDLTRTVAVGELSDEMKLDYTVTLKSHLVIARQKFPHGITGNMIDAIIKSNHWNYMRNFGHGAGHGMGYILNVHEGPGKIIMEYAPAFPYARNIVLEEGMLFSNEPGLYKPGRYGIRIENSVFVQKAEKNEFGQFMEFETITFLPYERKAIVVEELNSEELDWINRYHETVYKKLSPHLNDEEKAWLKEKTKPIQ